MRSSKRSPQPGSASDNCPTTTCLCVGVQLFCGTICVALLYKYYVAFAEADFAAFCKKDVDPMILRSCTNLYCACALGLSTCLLLGLAAWRFIRVVQGQIKFIMCLTQRLLGTGKKAVGPRERVCKHLRWLVFTFAILLLSSHYFDWTAVYPAFTSERAESIRLCFDIVIIVLLAILIQADIVCILSGAGSARPAKGAKADNWKRAFREQLKVWYRYTIQKAHSAAVGCNATTQMEDHLAVTERNSLPILVQNEPPSDLLLDSTSAGQSGTFLLSCTAVAIGFQASTVVLGIVASLTVFEAEGLRTPFVLSLSVLVMSLLLTTWALISHLRRLSHIRNIRRVEERIFLNKLVTIATINDSPIDQELPRKIVDMIPVPVCVGNTSFMSASSLMFAFIGSCCMAMLARFQVTGAQSLLGPEALHIGTYSVSLGCLTANLLLLFDQLQSNHEHSGKGTRKPNPVEMNQSSLDKLRLLDQHKKAVLREFRKSLINAA